MKLQVAIDRVPLEQALRLVAEVQDVADIVEVGTSLTKDYGMESVRAVHRLLDGAEGAKPQVLADIKTMDEGAYEFEAAYSAGADSATVMGAAALATVEACYRVAQDKGRDILIDLLETSPEKIHVLQSMENALFSIHLPKDGPIADIVEKVTAFCQAYPGIRRIAVAGGVVLGQIPQLLKLPIEVCIVGSAVTGANDPRRTAQEFASAMKA